MPLSKLKSFAAELGRKTGKLKYVVAAFALLGLGAFGTTFAGNISLNSGAPVEFGQGVTRIVACDDEITITPFSTFVNQVGAGSSLLTSLKVSGIDSSPNKCSGKTFTIRAYGDSGLLNLFNYTNYDTSVNQDFTSIEIYNNAGVFSWLSGGTDGDDLVNDGNVGDPGRDLTNTSFTINLTSNAQPIVRTALANAESVKSITVETYDAHLLANRILTTSQLGIITEANVLSLGFDDRDALPGGNFSGSCGMGCAGYFTARDWIANIPSEDLDNFNNQIGTSGLTRSQISNLITAKFVYDAGRPSDSRWKLIVYIGGVNSQSFSGSTDPNEGVEGSITGFNGNSGFFTPINNGPGTVLFFSVDSSLQVNSSIGSLTPYGDQPSRLVPIRDFINMWTYSDVPYTEDTP